MTAARRLRVGVAGAGWVATARHLPAYRRHPAVELAAVYDHRPDRAREVAGRAGIKRWCRKLDDFLAQELDIVSVCTPPWAHAEVAGRAMEAGAHVLTEKPMGMHLSEARSMAQAASATGRMLCVSHNLLFSRSFARAKGLLAGTAPIHAVAVQLSSTTRRLPTWYGRLPGGLLMDEVPHLLYTLDHFLGPLDEVAGRATMGADGHPAVAEVWLRAGPEGPTASLTMVLDAPVSEWHVALVTRERVVDLDLFRDVTVAVEPDGAHRPRDTMRTSSAALVQHVVGFAAAGMRYATKRQSWGHDELIHAFVDAALSGGASPVPVDDALRIVGLTDQLLAALGCRVHT